MKENYEMGGYGYGHAKKDLLELILNNYSEERQKYNHYISNPNEVNEILIHGLQKQNFQLMRFLQGFAKN